MAPINQIDGERVTRYSNQTAARGGASPDTGSATIFSALPDQLGLRLEPRKGPVDLLVIDSLQKTPTEN